MWLPLLCKQRTRRDFKVVSYFVLLLVSITSVLGVSIMRTRHSHQREAQRMRRHVLRLNDLERST